MAKEIIRKLKRSFVTTWLNTKWKQNLKSAEVHYALLLCQVQVPIRAFCAKLTRCGIWKKKSSALQTIFVQILRCIFLLQIKLNLFKTLSCQVQFSIRAFCVRLTRRDIWMKKSSASPKTFEIQATSNPTIKVNISDEELTLEGGLARLTSLAQRSLLWFTTGPH